MKHTKLTLCSFAILLAAGQAFAHTGVRDTANEGSTNYNAFTITHGCGNGTEGGPPAQSYPVLGQSALFPNGDYAVWRDQTGALIQVGGNGNGTISTPRLALSVAGISGGSPFETTHEIVDSLGVVQGLLWRDGAMAPNMNALTPFRVSTPTIANNCVKTLRVRIAVINYCDTDKNADNDIKGPYKAPTDALRKPVPLTTSEASGFVQLNAANAPVFRGSPRRGNGDNNRADWWFSAPYGGSALYNDSELLQTTYWTTLTVNNKADDLKACNGAQFDVSVEPSGAAFDSFLTGPNTRPFSKGNQGL